MNKKLYLLTSVFLILIFFLTSCSNNKKNSFSPTNTNTPDFILLQPDLSIPDEYYTSMSQGGRIAFSYLSTPYGKYHNVGGFLHYSQYGNAEFVKICTKDDCTHMYDDCNSFVGKDKQIGYYKSNIYFTEQTSSLTLNLIKINMDGTERQVVKNIISDPQIALKVNYGFFHMDYYYFLVTDGGEMGSAYNTDNNLYRIKLDDNSEYEIIFSNDIIPRISMFTLIEDNIFFYVNNTGVYPQDYKNLTTDSVDFELYMFSLTNNEIHYMTDKWTEYTNCHYDTEKGYCYKHNDGFYTLDLVTKQMVKVADSLTDEGWRSVAHFYPDYIYVITFTNTKDDKGYDQYFNNQTIYIFDRMYNLMDTYTIDVSGTQLGCMIEETNNYIILSSNYYKPADYFLYKSDIGNNSISLNKIE